MHVCVCVHTVYALRVCVCVCMQDRCMTFAAYVCVHGHPQLSLIENLLK